MYSMEKNTEGLNFSLSQFETRKKTKANNIARNSPAVVLKLHYQSNLKEYCFLFLLSKSHNML